MFSESLFFTQEAQKRLVYSMVFVICLLFAKLLGGYLSSSLALLTDSLHLMTDFLALLISWFGVKITTKPANHQFTFGHYRHGILTAFINNFILVIISVFILYKAYERALHPTPVNSLSMILFSIVGLLTNCLIYLVLRRFKENINIKSALLHFIGDALSDGFVLIGALVIYFTNWFTIDTYLSVFLAFLILKNAVKMIHTCIIIFLEATPKHISIDLLVKRLETLDQVLLVRDLHIWSLSEDVLSMTAHISTYEESIIKGEELIHKIQLILSEEFGIHHSTLQLEHAPCSSCYHYIEAPHNPCSLCINHCHLITAKKRV